MNSEGELMMFLFLKFLFAACIVSFITQEQATLLSR